MNKVIVVTKSFRDVMVLANSADVSPCQLIHAYSVEKIRGYNHGMKYVVIRTPEMEDFEKPILEYMATRENIEIQPEDVRAAVMGDAA